MSERGRTPGPWEVEPRPEPWFDLHVWSAGGRQTGAHIGTIGSEADAHLIAAAPALLEVCVEVLEFIASEHPGLQDDVGELYSKLYDLINQANGVEQ